MAILYVVAGLALGAFFGDRAAKAQRSPLLGYITFGLFSVAGVVLAFSEILS